MQLAVCIIAYQPNHWTHIQVICMDSFVVELVDNAVPQYLINIQFTLHAWHLTLYLFLTKSLYNTKHKQKRVFCNASGISSTVLHLSQDQLHSLLTNSNINVNERTARLT